jgi:calcineurin-like phosphoesterase family protein
MSNTWFASDHHFGHANMMNFFKRDGVTPLRPFVDADDMDETIIENHNRVVKPNDRVYLLGDLAIARRNLHKAARLNGRLKLLMGNHDPFVKNQNRDYFEMAGIEAVEAFHKFDKFVATHIPVHPACLSARWNVNVHGHTHDNLVMKSGFDLTGRIPMEVVDERYINVCMEHINYTPISLEEINARIDAR